TRRLRKARTRMTRFALLLLATRAFIVIPKPQRNRCTRRHDDRPTHSEALTLGARADHAPADAEHPGGPGVRIPAQTCHRFHGKAATRSTAKLPPIPVKPATP